MIIRKIKTAAAAEAAKLITTLSTYVSQHMAAYGNAYLCVSVGVTKKEKVSRVFCVNTM